MQNLPIQIAVLCGFLVENSETDVLLVILYLTKFSASFLQYISSSFISLIGRRAASFCLSSTKNNTIIVYFSLYYFRVVVSAGKHQQEGGEEKQKGNYIPVLQLV